MTRSTAPTAASVERECLRAAALVGLGVAATVVLLWASSFPGWPIAAGVIISVLVLAALMAISGAAPHPAARWLRPIGVVVALIVAIGGGVLVNGTAHAALATRFGHSQAAFQAVAASAGPVPRTVTDQWQAYPGDCPARIGTYRIEECHAFSGGFMYLQQRRALGDDAGFAYVPFGLLATEDGDNGLPVSGFTHLVGPWYAWSCGC